MPDPTPHSTSTPAVSLLSHREGRDGSVVVLDFVTFDQNSSAADLVAQALPTHRVLFADPVSDVAATGRSVPLADLARAYAESIAALDELPTVLAGYCSAAPLAHLVREELDAQGHDVPLLLIAPGFPTTAQVEESVQEVLVSLGSPARDVDLPDEPEAARQHIDRLLVDELEAATSRMGLHGFEAEILVEDLGARYRGWLGYLLSTVGVQPASDAGPVHVVALAEEHSAPTGGWPAGSVVMTTDVPRDRFLSSPGAGRDVAAAVAALVAPVG